MANGIRHGRTDDIHFSLYESSSEQAIKINETNMTLANRVIDFLTDIKPYISYSIHL